MYLCLIFIFFLYRTWLARFSGYPQHFQNQTSWFYIERYCVSFMLFGSSIMWQFNVFLILINCWCLKTELYFNFFWFCLRYLLRHKPKWNDKLKAEFLLAFNQIVKLMKAMQVWKLIVVISEIKYFNKM